jgi:hypothetical protein
MGNPLASIQFKHLEHDVQLLSGFIALDGASNVIGQAPVSAPVGAGPYSLCKGLMKSVGIAGAVVTQPHQSTGLYQFTLDEPWMALLWAHVTLFDPGAAALPVATVRANVRGNTTGPRAGVDPGTETTLLAQTVYVRFRTPATGALIDPAVSTGFWLNLLLKRTAIY